MEEKRNNTAGETAQSKDTVNMTDSRNVANPDSQKTESETRPEWLKPNVLDDYEIFEMVPLLKNHPRLYKFLYKLLAIDKVNWLHGRNYDKKGPGAVPKGMLDDLNVKLVVDNEQVLEHLPEGPFITVSNHPFGAMDGIILIYLISKHRPKYKVMVNMILNHISGMRPNFIAVDALASDDPKKKAVSMKGIKEAIMQVRSGNPIGFFPAGAVSKINGHLRIVDREWQPNIIRLIEQLKVPVIPVFFHGRNSTFFNLLGVISWKLRTLRLPREVFRRHDTTMHVSIGNPISVEEQKRHQGSLEEFGAFLKGETYKMRKWK